MMIYLLYKEAAQRPFPTSLFQDKQLLPFFPLALHFKEDNWGFTIKLHLINKAVKTRLNFFYTAITLTRIFEQNPDTTKI